MPAHIRSVDIKTKSGKFIGQNITCVHCWQNPTEVLEVDIVDQTEKVDTGIVLGLIGELQPPEMVAGEFLGKYDATIYQCKVCKSLIMDFRGQKYMLLKMTKGGE